MLDVDGFQTCFGSAASAFEIIELAYIHCALKENFSVALTEKGFTCISMERHNCLMIFCFLIRGAFLIIFGACIMIFGALVAIIGASDLILGSLSKVLGTFHFIPGVHAMILTANRFILGALQKGIT